MERQAYDALSGEARLQWTAAFEEACKSYRKLDQLAQELSALQSSSGLQCVSSTAHSLSKAHASDVIQFNPREASKIETLLLIGPGLRLDFHAPSSCGQSQTRLQAIQLTELMKRALSALALGQITKKEFFRKVWGEQKFVAEIHDEVIGRVVYRLRKATGLRIKSANSTLEIPNCLIV